MKLVIAGGGTGGHINPAVAIAKEFKKRDKNNEVLFIGTKRGLESRLVPAEGFNIEFIDVEGFKRKLNLHNVTVGAKFVFSVLRCKKILQKEKPDIVAGTGGYVSAPVVYAAALLKIPTLIQEQNAVAGVTTRMLSKYVDKICIGVNDKNIIKYPDKTVFTGNPIRSDFCGLSKEKSRRELNIDLEKPFVLCVSGSLGALKINESVTEFIKKNHNDIDYTFMTVTGDRYYEDVKREISDKNITIKNENIIVKNYLSDVYKYLSAADLVISRAGAIFLSEISYLGKPAILIPSPNVTENHQEKNADAFVKNNAAVKIKEQELNEKILKETIEKLIYNKKLLEEMSNNSGKMSVGNPAERIVDIIYETVKK